MIVMCRDSLARGITEGKQLAPVPDIVGVIIKAEKLATYLRRQEEEERRRAESQSVKGSGIRSRGGSQGVAGDRVGVSGQELEVGRGPGPDSGSAGETTPARGPKATTPSPAIFDGSSDNGVVVEAKG